MHIQPYLFFNGRCEEAIHHYQQTLDAELLMLMRYKESPTPHQPGMAPDGFDDKVMHASLQIGESVLMLSDGNNPDGPDFNGFFLSLGLADEAEVRRRFTALAKGGDVVVPLAPTFWSPCFGMLHDRYGVGWMIQVA